MDKVRTWHPVLNLMPPADWDETRRSSPTYIDMAAKWATIGPAYEAWKRGSEIPQDGTPLAAWSVFANLLALPLIVLMFVVEHCFRHRILPPEERSSVADTFRGYRAAMQRRHSDNLAKHP